MRVAGWLVGCARRKIARQVKEPLAEGHPNLRDARTDNDCAVWNVVNKLWAPGMVQSPRPHAAASVCLLLLLLLLLLYRLLLLLLLLRSTALCCAGNTT